MPRRNSRPRHRPERPTSSVPARRVPEEVTAAPTAGALRRSDAIDAGVVALMAAALFLTTFSTHVALGDAPESVSGVKALGVLHAPGYPSYVAVASAFARVFAFGGWALRVNGFSLVCAVLMIGAVNLLARSFGASRPGAALGALMLATTASFWFNADFAKHYPFSGLVVTVAALAVVHWQSGGRPGWLIVAGVALGAGAGASWELAAIMAVGCVLLLAFGTRRPSRALISASFAALVIVGAASYAFLMWRAQQHPAVNWGEVTDFHRLVAQVTQQDFRGPSDTATHSGVAKIATRTPQYVAIVARDVGFGGMLVALFGAIFAGRALDRGPKLFLAVVAVLNFLAVVFVIGNDRIAGFLTGLVAGGYLLDLLVVLAVLAALGTTPLTERASELSDQIFTPARDRSRASHDPHRFQSSFTVALFAIVLLPSIVVHYQLANHRQQPIADNYAKRVFAELPPHAVLFVNQADLTFPIVYRQTVFADRPDVSVIIETSLQFGWYREQIARTLHLRSPVRSGASNQQVQTLIAELRAARRPAFIDMGMMLFHPSDIPVRLRGLVGEVVNRTDTAVDRTALAATLIRADRADGIAGHDVPFPDGFVHFFYARAHIQLAKQFAAVNQLAPARTELSRALDDYPDDPTTRLVLRFSEQSGETTAKIVSVIEGL
jgi:hypothetical protein